MSLSLSFILCLSMVCMFHTWFSEADMRFTFNVCPYGLKIHTGQHDARCMERDAQGHHTIQLDIKMPQLKHKQFVVTLKNDINITFMVPNITIPITIPNIYFTNDMHQILMMFQ